MKKLTVILFVLLGVTISKAQKIPANIYTNAEGHPIIYTASSGNSNFGLGLTIDANTKWIEYNNQLPNQPLNNYVFLKGTKKVGLIATIPVGDVQKYRYNIIENDSVDLAVNTTPNNLTRLSKFNNRISINLGTFDVENKKLTIETYKISERNKVSTTILYNKEIKPAILSFTTLGVTNTKAGSAVMMKHEKDGFSFKIHDSNKKVTVNSIWLCVKPTDQTFLYNVYVKNLSSGKTSFVSNNWLYNFFFSSEGSMPYLTIDASFFENPGNYEISIIPKLPSGFRIKSFPNKATIIHFTVLKSDTEHSQKAIIVTASSVILLILIVAGLVVYYNRKSNRKMLVEQKKQRDLAQIQLNSVRLQLNPHFLFNALSGIQNLMNKNDIDQANRYLTKFARLTRNVLKSDELINITEEVALLDDYLQMEQLRFGFTYHINIDKNLDPANTEIPSMLLQPFVENAVKHGISDLGTDGEIDIDIIKQSKDLVLSVTDNGNGFNTAKENQGLGLELSKKRIALLNTIYKESPVWLDIQSGKSGTVIKITLTQWL